LLATCLAYSSLKMDAVCSFKMLVTIWRLMANSSALVSCNFSSLARLWGLVVDYAAAVSENHENSTGKPNRECLWLLSPECNIIWVYMNYASGLCTLTYT
jgi:hypothetical protein